jgi:hypothetical protein
LNGILHVLFEDGRAGDLKIAGHALVLGGLLSVVLVSRSGNDPHLPPATKVLLLLLLLLLFINTHLHARKRGADASGPAFAMERIGEGHPELGHPVPLQQQMPAYLLPPRHDGLCHFIHIN